MKITVINYAIIGILLTHLASAHASQFSTNSTNQQPWTLSQEDVAYAHDVFEQEAKITSLQAKIMELEFDSVNQEIDIDDAKNQQKILLIALLLLSEDMVLKTESHLSDTDRRTRAAQLVEIAVQQASLLHKQLQLQHQLANLQRWTIPVSITP